MTRIPTPKYDIGSQVWGAGTATRAERMTCPDCLDSHAWEARTAGGEVFTFPCPRCNSFYTQLPPPIVHKHAPVVEALTIGSVQLDTNREDAPVSYMCVETGIGSGRVYRERELAATKEEAQRIAQSMADAANLQPEEKARISKAEAYAAMTYQNAANEQLQERERDIRFTLQDVQRIVFDEDYSDADARQQLKEKLESVPC